MQGARDRACRPAKRVLAHKMRLVEDQLSRLTALKSEAEARWGRRREDEDEDEDDDEDERRTRGSVEEVGRD